MSRLSSRVFIIFIIVLTLASCKNSNDEGPPSKELTWSDAGSNVTLLQGETVKVSLRGNGSTGYTWEVVPDTESILSQQGDKQFEPDGDAVGADGLYIFTFKAIASGNFQLKLIYHRPWETDVAPLQTFEVTIIVGT